MFTRSLFRHPLVPALLCLGLAPLAAANPFAPTPRSGNTMQQNVAAQVAQKPVLTTLHRFDFVHGAFPTTPLTLGKDGNFYGVSEGGITNGDYDSFGTIFKITPSGQFTTLWRFDGINGHTPSGKLVQGADGNFYGVTHTSVFRITAQGQFKIFSKVGTGEGAYFAGALLPAADGSFYGVTTKGNASNLATVFHITASGQAVVLYTFDGAQAQAPTHGLVFGSDGALYGTAGSGTDGSGVVYRLTLTGKLTVLHTFTASDGAYPEELTPGTDGALYGMTLGGGQNGNGTIYKITLSGKFTVLHMFSRGKDGSQPYSALTLGADGSFYGTAAEGGYADGGTVFSMTPSGQFTALYKFHTNFDGFEPFGGVAFGPDGVLYGTTNTLGTQANGHDAFGTIYKLTLPQ